MVHAGFKLGVRVEPGVSQGVLELGDEDPMASALDKQIGAQVRARRRARGWTQLQLAESVGLQPQRIHKYESGENAMSGATLWRIARALEVDIRRLYEGCEAPPSVAAEQALAAAPPNDAVRRRRRA